VGVSEVDGLSLDQVRDQWRESQRLLDEVRSRLEVITSVKESSERSARSLESSDETLRKLIALLAEAVDEVRVSQTTAINVLDAMGRALESIQPDQLQARLQQVADDTSGTAKAQAALATTVSKSQEELVAKMKSLETGVAGIWQGLAEVKSLVESATSNASSVASVTAERDKARNDLQRALAVLPARFQTKVQATLRS
jgi:ABC-type transporter Mla subunit MlaD